MTFSDNLNRICKERGITATALLKEMGISTSKVTMWNNGSLPKQDMLLRLAQALDCAVMDFFREDEVDDIGEILRSRRHPTPTVDLVDISEDEQYIIRFFRSISSKEKHIFMARIYDYEEVMSKRKE